MQAFFRVSEVTEREQAQKFTQRFGVDLEKVPQAAGVVGDYLILKTSGFTNELEAQLGYPLAGRLVEFKDDKASVKRGTFFIEYEQTSDSWCTRRASGHEKAILEGCVLVMSTGSLCLVYNEASYKTLIEGVLRERTTRFRKNGNRPDSFTKGRIVTVEHAISCATFMYDMSEQAGFQAIPF